VPGNGNPKKTASKSSAPVDGRVQRGERNRAAIVDAMLALIEAGDLTPSARDIAERAGVSLRSVFQHFDDLETLYAAVAQRQFARIAVDSLDVAMPFDARLAEYLRTRTATYEAITPVRRAALLASVDSPTLQRGLAFAARRHAEDVAASFAPECNAAAQEALVLVTSWETWDRLRRTQRLSVTAARAVMDGMVRSILGSTVA
jgi:TetR/AcrR family transcriptional regulator, regulator of autoinduction and epiphytic fitness